MAVYLTRWRTRSGKVRYIRLYRTWKNLQARTAGTQRSRNGASYWAGKRVEFISWGHFRRWSLENGYSRTFNSLDRREGHLGYGPNNCTWTTTLENSLRAAAKHAFMTCECFSCRYKYRSVEQDAAAVCFERGDHLLSDP